MYRDSAWRAPQCGAVVDVVATPHLAVDGLTSLGDQPSHMPTAVHQLDDGAWISVNDSRAVNVSELWLLADSDVCDCEPTDFLAEGFVDVGVDHPNVQARVAGQCIACGANGVSDWLTVGRVIDPETGEFHGVELSSIHLPAIGRGPRGTEE